MGVMFSLLFVLRMIAATLPLAIMLSVTQVSDLSGMLVEKLHVPYKYVFAMTTSMRFIPIFAAEAADIMAAQTSRGVDFDTKNFLRKIRLILPLCVPLLLSSVERIDRGAISAE
jgi:energy-coupling factor transport system permease protein